MPTECTPDFFGFEPLKDAIAYTQRGARVRIISA